MTSHTEDTKGPAVSFPPPLLVLSIIVVGFLLNKAIPFILLNTILAIMGYVLFIIGAIIIVYSAMTFRKAKTHIEPWKPTSTIISSGLFRYSRNPIYLAFCLEQAGIGLFTGNFWLLLFIPVTMWLLFHVAIQKEENYLAEKFGDSYLDYKKQVRRWL